jgi:hypothetical protein
VSYGKFNIYLRNGSSLVMSNQAICNVYHEPQVKIQQSPLGANLYACPALNYDYTEVKTTLCPKLPPVEVIESEVNVPDTTNIPPNTVIEQPTDSQNNPQTNNSDAHILSPQTNVVSGQQNLYASQNTYWVCAVGNLRLTGDQNIIYAESGASLLITGNRNTIYLKSGAKLRLGFGSGNQLNYQNEADLLADESRKTRFTKFFQMDFDTSQVPSGGCR